MVSDIKSKKQKQTEEAELIKSLFVTQEEEAYEDFEQEKDNQVENQIGKSVERKTIKQGWGSWAGDGVDNSRIEANQIRLDSVRQKKIEEIKKQRQDARLRGVQINETEERDKKFAQKYWVKDLPYQFSSAKQFDALMSMPVGKEWNTQDSYKRLIQSDVLTKAGEIIKPLRFKKDLPIETIEKLVQHRQSRRANRTAAKF